MRNTYIEKYNPIFLFADDDARMEQEINRREREREFVHTEESSGVGTASRN